MRLPRCVRFGHRAVTVFPSKSSGPGAFTIDLDNGERWCEACGDRSPL